MTDSSLRLQDKTILIVGPFNGITQAVTRTLTEFGADVAMVSPHPHASKYTEAINEAREVHPEYGRAVPYNLPFSTEAQIQEILGRVVESIGRVDSLVDATPLAWLPDSVAEHEQRISTALTDKVLPFLLAKQRGRIVYVCEDPSLDRLHVAAAPAECRDRLAAHVQTLATTNVGRNVTVNMVSLGLTEDFLLRTKPKSPTIKKSLEELQKTEPGVKLVEAHDVSLSVAYLLSALSGAVTGQTLRLTHGFHLGAGPTKAQ